MSIGIAMGLHLGRGGAVARRIEDAENLAFLFDAAAITGLNDADAVASWVDSGPNAKHAVQANATKQPVYKVNILNGEPVVRFGADDGMQTPAIDLTGTGAVTLFAVFSAPSASIRVVAELGPIYSSNNNAFALIRDSNNTVLTAMTGNGGATNFSSTATLTTTAKLVSAVYDKSLATNEVTNWVNSVTAGTRGSNNNNTTQAFGNLPLNIGARNDGASLFSSMDCAFLAAIARALPDAERQAYETQLMTRFGLS